jgi:hypothetical protein
MDNYVSPYKWKKGVQFRDKPERIYIWRVKLFEE